MRLAMPTSVSLSLSFTTHSHRASCPPTTARGVSPPSASFHLPPTGPWPRPWPSDPSRARPSAPRPPPPAPPHPPASHLTTHGPGDEPAPPPATTTTHIQRLTHLFHRQAYYPHSHRALELSHGDRQRASCAAAAFPSRNRLSLTVRPASHAPASQVPGPRRTSRRRAATAARRAAAGVRPRAR